MKSVLAALALALFAPDADACKRAFGAARARSAQSCSQQGAAEFVPSGRTFYPALGVYGAVPCAGPNCPVPSAYFPAAPVPFTLTTPAPAEPVARSFVP